jgi:hypothetical protein
MTCFAVVDGAPKGWAVVVMALNRITIQKVVALSDLFDVTPSKLSAGSCMVGRGPVLPARAFAQ